MKFITTEFSGLFIIEPTVLSDSRGCFFRTFDIELFRANIPNFEGSWKQMNQSYNTHKSTFRGLHFQKPPAQESKLIRCISGAVIDFALDLRKDSPTFLNVFKTELSSENKRMVYLPKGFAHGFFTLKENTELIYLHDEFYKPEFDSGIRYFDEMIKDKIDIEPDIISEKDLNYTLLETSFKGI